MKIQNKIQFFLGEEKIQYNGKGLVLALDLTGLFITI